jgi:uncharacterized protein YggE
MSGIVTAATRSRIGWLASGALVGVLSAVIVSPGLAPALAQSTAPGGAMDHTLSVSGTGIVYVKPDIADVSLGVTVRRNTAKDASAASAAIMTKVIDAVKAQGVADADIQTISIGLNPAYDYSGNNPKLVGYDATNIVQVTVRDLTKAGAVIDAATEAGANTVNGISFRVADQSAVESQARTAAMNDAKAKADTLAAAGGVTITGIIAISELSAPSPTPYPFAQGGGAGDVRASTPVQGGNVELTVTVSVVYGIN